MITYRKNLLPMNLQLFAGERSIVIGGERITVQDDDAEDGNFSEDADDILQDIEVEDDESDDDADSKEDDTDGENDDDDDQQQDDDADDDSEDDKDDDSEEDTTKSDKAKKGDKGKKQQDNPVAKAVIAERKRLQSQMEEFKKQADATKRFMKLLGVDNIDVLQERLDAAEAKRIEKATGVTPEQAAEQVRTARELERQKGEIRALKYDSEVRKLRQDPFFADIEDYREEYEEIAERTGQSLEEVYMAKRGRQRMKEYQREAEARASANRNKRQRSGIDTSSSGTQVQKVKHNLTPEQLAVAKAAVKMGTFKDVAEYEKLLKRK